MLLLGLIWTENRLKLKWGYPAEIRLSEIGDSIHICEGDKVAASRSCKVSDVSASVIRRSFSMAKVLICFL